MDNKVDHKVNNKMNRRPAKPSPAAQASDDQSLRLNRYIAQCGLASRRKADELIEEGKVMVNGKKVYELGIKIDPSKDRITVSGKSIRQAQEFIYILFYKPKGVLTSMSDPLGRPTVGDFFKRLPMRIFPVGRLDWDSEGLLLLTNDGDFSNQIMHPSEDIPKTYLVKVDGHPAEAQLARLMRGLGTEVGRVRAEAVEKIQRGGGKYDWLKITISEGRNRQVRRMFEKVGFDVLKLKRIAIGKLQLGRLEKGEFKVIPKDKARLALARSE